MSRIPLSAPSFNGNEWKYVKECIDTEWVSSAGKYVDIFETNISTYTKSKFAIFAVYRRNLALKVTKHRLLVLTLGQLFGRRGQSRPISPVFLHQCH